jgi:periplasmic protein TonB
MTADIVPESFAPGYIPSRGDFWRWAGSIAVALAVHMTAVLGLVDWDEPVFGAERPSITVDLVPFVNPLAELRDDAPGPLQPQSEPTPQSHAKLEEEQSEKTEYTLVVPDGDTMRRRPDNPETQAAPPSIAAPEATAPPPPRPSVAQVASWHRQIAMQIERHKAYPATARARHQTGIAQLAFAIDRRGMVLASRIIRSSGSAALDQETIATVRRAQPFPAPPPNMAGERFDFTIPIRFNIR